MLAGLFRSLDDLPRVEAFIENALGNEFGEASEIDPVGRHSVDDGPRALRRAPVCTYMTGGAIQRDTIETEAMPARRADRAIHPLFIGEAQRLPTIARQVIRAQRWHSLEDPDG